MSRHNRLRANPDKIRAWKDRTRKNLPKHGKRTDEWAAMRQKLKPAFERAGITSCEIRKIGCWGSVTLGYAHTHKRRNIPTGSPLLIEVVLACTNCHRIVESMGEGMMGEYLLGIIRARPSAVLIN